MGRRKPPTNGGGWHGRLAPDEFVRAQNALAILDDLRRNPTPAPMPLPLKVDKPVKAEIVTPERVNPGRCFDLDGVDELFAIFIQKSGLNFTSRDCQEYISPETLGEMRLMLFRDPNFGNLNLPRLGYPNGPGTFFSLGGSIIRGIARQLNIQRPTIIGRWRLSESAKQKHRMYGERHPQNKRYLNPHVVVIAIDYEDFGEEVCFGRKRPFITCDVRMDEIFNPDTRLSGLARIVLEDSFDALVNLGEQYHLELEPLVNRED